MVIIGFLSGFGLVIDSGNPINSLGMELTDETWSMTDLLLTLLISHIFIGLSIFLIQTTDHGNDTVG